MIISHIVAVSKNFVIGKNNRLPWRMPKDMQYFHDVTRGHIVLMGRKNYEANGGALEERTNIVISRDLRLRLPDAEVVNSLDAALQMAETWHPEEIFIVGGGEIYHQSLPLVNRIYITVIDFDIDGDAYYPVIDFNNYRIISKYFHQADEDNPHDHTYYILEK